jgi:hypothetical protein
MMTGSIDNSRKLRLVSEFVVASKPGDENQPGDRDQYDTKYSNFAQGEFDDVRRTDLKVVTDRPYC